MGASSNTESNIEEKNSKNGKEVPIEPMNEIDVNQLPYKHVKNKEIYLLKLVSKKLIITDSHLSDGIKPTDEDNIIMTRLNIEIEEQMKKIFHNKKLKKKKKIRLNPDSHAYKYDELIKQIEIADYQWEDLNGEHEEFKKLVKEKKKQDNFVRLRGLHRQDLFYPDEEDDDDNNEQIKNNNNDNNINNNYNNNNKHNKENSIKFDNSIIKNINIDDSKIPSLNKSEIKQSELNK